VLDRVRQPCALPTLRDSSCGNISLHVFELGLERCLRSLSVGGIRATIRPLLIWMYLGLVIRLRPQAVIGILLTKV